MKQPVEYTSLNVPAVVKSIVDLDLSFKKRIFDADKMDELRGNAKVQQILLMEMNKVISLRNKLEKFRNNLLKNKNSNQGE